MGIEPTYSAWKADVLPLNYTRNKAIYVVPMVGVEPTLPKEHDFESCASANSATSAKQKSYVVKSGAEDRNRTGTVVTYRRILSPVRLPVPPPRQNKIGGGTRI